MNKASKIVHSIFVLLIMVMASAIITIPVWTGALDFATVEGAAGITFVFGAWLVFVFGIGGYTIVFWWTE